MAVKGEGAGGKTLAVRGIWQRLGLDFFEGCSEEGRQIHPGHHWEFVSKDQAHHQGRAWGNDV